VFTRDQLLRHVWDSEPEWQGVGTVSEHVHRLRAKIECDPTRPGRIVTVRGVGYRFVP
jgi:DNA-binding response OmpR family regulator